MVKQGQKKGGGGSPQGRGPKGGASKSGSKIPELQGRLVCDNKKARFEFEVLETVDAGLSLRGTEVKVLRDGKVSLEESHARIHDDEVFLVGAHIAEYSHGNVQNHEPRRRRKCLLRKREIRRLREKVQQKGLTLVPLRLFFSARGYAKVTLALCRGRKVRDKREHVKDREAKKELRQI